MQVNSLPIKYPVPPSSLGRLKPTVTRIDEKNEFAEAVRFLGGPGKTRKLEENQATYNQ